MKRGWRVTAEANCVPFLSALLRAGVKLRVTLPLQADWVPVPVLNCVQDCVCVFLCDKRQGARGTSVSDLPESLALRPWRCWRASMEVQRGERARERSHAHSVCRAHCDVMCVCFITVPACASFQWCTCLERSYRQNVLVKVMYC